CLRRQRAAEPHSYPALRRQRRLFRHRHRAAAEKRNALSAVQKNRTESDAMTERANVIVYGAYDRHNYGDLLFAIILNRYLEAKGFNVLVAATKNSDLSRYGALPTIALKRALEASRTQPST